MFVLRFTQPRQKIPFVKRNHIERNGNPSPSKSLKKESKYSSHKSNNAYKQQQQNNNFQRSKTPNNMVIQTSKPESTYVNTSIADENTSAKFSKSMTEQIESLVFYFKTFGEAGNDEFELAFQEAFHRDFVLESTKGNMNLKELFVMVKALRSRGSLVEVLDSIDNGDGTATLTIRFTLGREESPDVVRRRYWFHDGKAIRAACLKSDQFDNVIQKAQIRAVAELQKQMIACFDGSSDAYAKAEPIIDQLCHVDYVMEAGDGSKMNLQQFKSWAKGFADARNVAKQLKTEITETGIHVWIQNIANGEDLGVTEQVGTMKNGKIVHWKAVKQDAKSFSDMVGKVAALTQQSQINTVAELYKQMIACFDGSSDAYAKAEPIIDQIFHPGLEIEQGDGTLMTLQGFKKWAKGASEIQHVAKLLKTEIIETGIHVWIQTFANGEDQGVTEQVGSTQGGKIHHWRAVKPDEKSFSYMIETVAALTQQSQINTVAELEKQMIACFDGSPDAYSKAEPIIDQLCHVDYVMEAGDGSKMNLQQFKSWAKGYADARNVAKLLKTEVTETGIKVWIQNTVNGEDLGVTEQVGTVQDGKIVHWKAVKQDAKSFSDMIEKVRAQDKSTEIKEVARTFTEDQLSCFDGSADAYAKVKPILDRLYDEKFVMETGDGSKLNLQQFQSLLRSFSEARGIAKPIKTELTSNGFHVWIQNAMNGEDLGVTEQVGTVQDGKIVYWKAVKQDSNSFLVLLDTVSQRADGMLGNVARLKAYLNALDGTSTAWERFEPHIDQVLSRDIVWVDETSDISMKRSEIVDLIKNKYIPNGGYPVLETVKDNGDNSLTVVIRNHFPGAEEGEATRQTLYYNSDDLIQKLVSSDFVGGTCQRIAALPKKE